MVGVLNKKERRRVRVAAVATFAAVLMLFVIRGAFAALVEPVAQEGNPTCSDLNSGWTGVSVAGPGTYTFDSLTITVTAVNDPSVVSGELISWTSNTGIDAVFVKGGPMGNLYTYDPPADQTSDSGLHTPANPNGAGPKWYGLSHLLFCYATTEETGGTTTGGSSTGGSSTGSSTGGSSTGETSTGSTGETSTGGSSTGSSTGETSTGSTGETSTTGTTGQDTTGGSSTGSSTAGTSTTGSSTGETTGTQVGASTATRGTSGGTGNEVLGRVIHRKPLAMTGSATTALAWVGMAMLMIGVTLRYGRFGTREVYATAANDSAATDLIAKALRARSRNRTCRR